MFLFSFKGFLKQSSKPSTSLRQIADFYDSNDSDDYDADDIGSHNDSEKSLEKINPSFEDANQSTNSIEISKCCFAFDEFS